MAPAGYDKLKIAPMANLEDKEVYLVQVPKTFDTRKAEFKSNTEVTCEGTTYFVNSSAALAECNLLNADNDGKLIPSSTKLSGLLSFTKKVSLPKVDYEKVAQPKPLVPQKENLRMRHFPSGYGPESYGITGEAAAQKPKDTKPKDTKDAAPNDEKKSNDGKKSHKHKHGRDGEDSSEKPAKKHKKNSDEKKKSKKEKHKSKD